MIETQVIPNTFDRNPNGTCGAPALMHTAVDPVTGERIPGFHTRRAAQAVLDWREDVRRMKAMRFTRT